MGLFGLEEDMFSNNINRRLDKGDAVSDLCVRLPPWTIQNMDALLITDLSVHIDTDDIHADYHLLL